MVFELAESRTNDSNAHLEPVLADSQARDSLHHLTLNCALPRATSTLESQRSDPDAMQIDSPRPSSSFSLHPNLILISDKTSSTAGTITGLFCTPHRTNQLAAPTLFEAHLPRRVMRLRNGLVRPSWRRLPATPNGVVADDIVGTTTDGHVYAFSLLDRHALAVLKTLEDAVKSEQAVRLKRYGGLDSAERDKVTIRMGSGARNGNWAFEYDDEDLSHRAVGMRRGEGGPEARHVDGDVLEPLLARGGEEKMLTLLEMDEERGGMSEEKYEDFVQIAGTVLGVEEETLMDKSRLSKELIRWLKMVLAPIL